MHQMPGVPVLADQPSLYAITQLFLSRLTPATCPRDTANPQRWG